MIFNRDETINISYIYKTWYINRISCAELNLKSLLLDYGILAEFFSFKTKYSSYWPWIDKAFVVLLLFGPATNIPAITFRYDASLFEASYDSTTTSRDIKTLYLRDVFFINSLFPGKPLIKYLISSVCKNTTRFVQICGRWQIKVILKKN